MSHARRIETPLPHRALHQNARVHYAALFAARAADREAGRRAALAAFSADLPPDPWDSCHVLMVITWPDRRRRDVLNTAAACKSLIDGITDAGVVWRDDSDIRSWRIVTRQCDRAHRGREGRDDASPDAVVPGILFLVFADDAAMLAASPFALFSSPL